MPQRAKGRKRTFERVPKPVARVKKVLRNESLRKPRRGRV